MPTKKIIALSLIFAGFGIIIGFIILNFFRHRQPTAGLKIDTTPSSLVFVDGQEIGNTPIEKYLPPGEISLKLIPQASSSALATYETKIRLTDKVFTVVHRDFAPSDSQSSGEIISLQPTSESAASLSVVTSGPPSASVVFDNQPQGFTPLSLSSITPGSHQLTISSPGYLSRTVQVQAVNSYRLVLNIKLAQQEIASITPTPSPTPTNSSGTPATPDRPYVKILSTPTGFLRVRSSPALSGLQVGQVEPGQQFPLLDSEAGWYLISAALESTSSGWISSQYAQKYE